MRWSAHRDGITVKHTVSYKGYRVEIGSVPSWGFSCSITHPAFPDFIISSETEGGRSRPLLKDAKAALLEKVDQLPQR